LRPSSTPPQHSRERNNHSLWSPETAKLKTTRQDEGTKRCLQLAERQTTFTALLSPAVDLFFIF
jgi:hypothetical protein